MIEIQQYQIDSNRIQYILREKKRHPKDHPKTPNKEYFDQAKFFSTFEQCLNEIMNGELIRLTAKDSGSLLRVSMQILSQGLSDGSPRT